MMREDLPIQTEREKKSESYLSNRETLSLSYQEDDMNLSLATIKLDIMIQFWFSIRLEKYCQTLFVSFAYEYVKVLKIKIRSEVSW